MEIPSADFDTEKTLFAALPGGQAVIDWFGFCPSFHDAVQERLELASGDAALTLRTSRMTSEVDAKGYYLQDRHASVTLRMRGVSGVKLEGDAGSILSRLAIRRLDANPDRSDWRYCAGPERGDIEIAFDTVVGLYGTLYAQELVFELQPLPAQTDDQDFTGTTGRSGEPSQAPPTPR